MSNISVQLVVVVVHLLLNWLDSQDSGSFLVFFVLAFKFSLKFNLNRLLTHGIGAEQARSKPVSYRGHPALE